ncbi:MAG: ferredoxin reductase family protein [Patescibacteria group bacterium]
MRAGSFAGIFIALGRITGLLSEFLILFQLVLIGRIRFIEKQFGHDELNNVHRWVGTYIIIFLVAHPLLLSIGWGSMTDTSYWAQFLSFISDWHDVVNALIGLIIFTIAIILSLTVFRKKLKYERWHFTHLFIYIAIVLALEHQTKSGDLTRAPALYYWLTLNYAVFGLILFYRFLRPFYLFARHRFKIEKIVAESNDVTSIYISGKDINKFSFDAGQFAIINFLKWGMLSSHPFSISCAPNNDYLRFTIKSLGDFTNRIKELSPGTGVIIDGPLGTFTEKKSKTKRFLFIAAGVGITPIAGIIDSLTKKGITDITLLYCIRSAAQIPFRAHFDELPIKTYYLISDAGAGYGGKEYISGRLDKDKIKQLAPDYLDCDIFFCGPPNMHDPVTNMLKELGVRPGRLHYEKFSF